MVLPLIIDDDSPDYDFYIEAKMRNNPKIHFWPKPSPTYKNQFEIWSNVLTVGNIKLGFHDVDIQFIDKVTKVVGVNMSVKVEVLSLGDFMKAGLNTVDSSTPVFTGTVSCNANSEFGYGDEYGDYGDYGDEGDDYGDEDAGGEYGDEGGEGEYGDYGDEYGDEYEDED